KRGFFLFYPRKSALIRVIRASIFFFRQTTSRVQSPNRCFCPLELSGKSGKSASHSHKTGLNNYGN
ncbi:MAG: hypothetical protein KDE56_04475, partial [Anaerolineales bacterium]|nr:hypothetical protein [Anaerolineales bacterium]